jgi:hypothetical protein
MQLCMKAFAYPPVFQISDLIFHTQFYKIVKMDKMPQSKNSFQSFNGILKMRLKQAACFINAVLIKVK